MPTPAQAGSTAGTSSPAHALPSHKPVVLLLAACAVFAAWVATQSVAFRLGYQRTLGPWSYAAPPAQLRFWLAFAALLVLLAVVTLIQWRSARLGPSVAVALLAGATVAGGVGLGPVYAPYYAIVWAFRYEQVAAVAPIARGGLYTMLVVLMVALAAAFAARPARRRRPPSTSHGSASWDPGTDLLGGMRGASGVALGRPLVPPRPTRRAPAPGTVFRYAHDGHLLTVAPTRSGKGVGAVIPNLLTYPGSVVVNDSKGENYMVTRAAREKMDHEVIALDPFGITDAPFCQFNPLDMIDPEGPDVFDDAMLLADMLVVTGGPASGGDDGHWDPEARALLAGLILYVAVKEPREGGNRTLPEVRRLVNLEGEALKQTLEAMKAYALERTVTGPLIASAAARVLQKADKERSSVFSTAQRHTHFLESPRMKRVLESSGEAGGGLNLDRLKTERVSLFVILPAERLSTYRGWLRLINGCALLSMERVRRVPEHRVLFMLDEFANMGRMQIVADKVALVGGFGVTFWFIIQDLSQLKATYRDQWETFEGNVQVLQTFGTNDLFTAEHLSKRIGDATIYVDSENRSAGRSQGRSSGSNESAALTVSEKGRRLLTPDEVMRLPLDQQLLFVRGHAPILARKLNYLSDPELAGLAEWNPMYGADPNAPAPAAAAPAPGTTQPAPVLAETL